MLALTVSPILKLGARTSALAFLLAAGLLLADKAWAHGAIDAKIAELRERLLQSPEDAAVHFELADAYAEHGEWSEATKALSRSEELAPGLHPSELVRARIEMGMYRPSLAIEQLESFLVQYPKHSARTRALVLKARALREVDRFEEALATYGAALAGNADSEVFQETADVYAARQRIAEAAEVLATGLARLGPDPSLLVRALRHELALGRFDLALSRVDALRQSSPQPEEWMAKRATVLEQAGRKAEARAAWLSLQSHIASLPALQRGNKLLLDIAQSARLALGDAGGASPRSIIFPPAPVKAPPASPTPSATSLHNP